MRNITVSTCGIIPKIEAFASDFMQVNLAISLHAPNDTVRNKLMPISKKYRYAELMEACMRYTQKTHRRITFEYTLIAGLNDEEAHADELAFNLQGKLCHVNLIPMNSVSGFSLKSSARSKAEMFLKKLEMKGVPATIRREMGSDISAACGQLLLHKSGI